MENRIHTYDEAFEASKEYFNQDELAAKVFLDKYSLRDNDQNILEPTPREMHRRIASEFARIEKKKFKKPLSEDEIYSLLDGFKYIIPQGSPMFGIGNSHQLVSLSNCYVVDSPKDSYGGILKTDEELAQISKRRGGVGVDISTLRPQGSGVKNAARTSTGIVSWMERYSNTIREVGQSGRRGALMLTVDVAHTDIEKFITIKNDETKVTGANISVRLSNEFLNAVENGEKFRLRYPVDAPPSDSDRWVDAKELWNKIIHNAWMRAEPGLLFWDEITSHNMVDCYKEFGFQTVSTNPCSELPLCTYDSCRLMVVNLFSYVENPFTSSAKFNFELFEKHVWTCQRLMDDMIDLELEKIDGILKKIESDPEDNETKKAEYDLWKKIQKKCKDGRRTGTGITATGDMLAALGIAYGSDESIDVVDSIHKTMMVASFRSSVDMAKELGAFPVWNWDLEKDTSFAHVIKNADLDLYNDIKKYGRRNIANLTIAPTGSLSILSQTTSGIEPLFMLFPYTRRKKINPNDANAKTDFVDPNGDHWQEFEVYHPKVKMWMDVTGETDLKKSPWFGYCAEDIDWVRAVKLQSVAQKYIDHAISKTVNLPEEVTEEEVAKIYEAAWKMGCKGMTVYRKNCRTGVLVEKKTEAPKNDAVIQKNNAPKRPESLPGEAHISNIKGQPYYVVVGLLGTEPYEIFTGMNEHQEESADKGSVNKIIPKNGMSGTVIKKSRGNYVFRTESGDHKLTNGHNDENADALCRMISTSLRHGSDIGFVVHQLEKTKGDLMSFAKVLARILKKYIKDGTKVHGEECPSCSANEVERGDGCVICKSCGWTKCA
jgi:ribonucleoside-diphosphate reductase alpha chain